MSYSGHSTQRGAVSGLLIAAIIGILLAAGFAVTTVLAYVNYSDQKNNVDDKIAAAVADAKKEQSDIDEAKFAEREKQPNLQFVGPDDYGRLTFMYPKTWSAYVAKDVSRGGNFEAYLNPGTVPPVSQNQRYALRVTILEQDYDRVVGTYASLVKEGKLQTSAITTNGHTGTRLDGSFTDEIRGAIVIFKLRDKTVTIRVDADTFKPDFEAVIKTIDFNT